MDIRRLLEKAITALLAVQHADGGIPAGALHHDSGCWTTANVLYDILSAQLIPSTGLKPIYRMTHYILDKQIAEPATESGSWPTAQGLRGSALSTGHCCASLQAALTVFETDESLRVRVETAIENGLSWLRRTQNLDGGWGTETSAQGEAKSSSIIGTTYALLGLSARRDSESNSKSIQLATIYLKNSQQSDGSWPARPRFPSDPCSTARALASLIRTGSCTPADAVVKDGLAYILRTADPQTGLWTGAEEHYYYADAGGVITFQQNTPCDVLVLFALIGYDGPEVYRLVSWLLETQEPETGLWPLTSPNAQLKEIITWPTAEWIYALGICDRCLERPHPRGIAAKDVKTARLRTDRLIRLMAVLATLAAFIGYIGFSYSLAWSRVHKLYRWLPVWTRWILGAIILGAIINALADLMRHESASISSRLRRWITDIDKLR